MARNVPPSSPADGELIRRCQAGDREAFGELYRRYLGAIYGYIRLRVDSERDAEDLTEMVFVKSFEAMGKYQERGVPFAAFLYKVARNLVVDSYRSKVPVLPLEAAETHPDDAPAVEAQLEKREQGSAAVAALARLSERHQEVIRLRVLLGLPTGTVAAWMGNSPTGTRVLLHRALKALRTLMETGDE